MTRVFTRWARFQENSSVKTSLRRRYGNTASALEPPCPRQWTHGEIPKRKARLQKELGLGFSNGAILHGLLEALYESVARSRSRCAPSQFLQLLVRGTQLCN